MQWRNNSAALGQGPGSSLEKAHNDLIWDPTQGEDGNFWLSTSVRTPDRMEPKASDWIPRIPPSYLPTNWSEKGHTSYSLPHKFCLQKNLPWKTLGSLGFGAISHQFSLLCPEINLSLLQTPMLPFIWPHVCQAHELGFSNDVNF